MTSNQDLCTQDLYNPRCQLEAPANMLLIVLAFNFLLLLTEDAHGQILQYFVFNWHPYSSNAKIRAWKYHIKHPLFQQLSTINCRFLHAKFQCGITCIYTATPIQRHLIKRYFGYNSVFSWFPNYFQKISVGPDRHKFTYFRPHQNE